MKTSFGQYEIIEKIGTGGMGTVWKARDRILDRIVALKVLHWAQSLSDHSRARFMREAQAMARLSHRNIVSIYSVGESRGTPYIAMEFVQGQSLADVVKDSTIPEQLVVKWFVRIAKAVAHAHQKGIVHRDLKPGNILIGPRDEPKVMDFGLAKDLRAQASLTMEGDVLGTPAYMAPEQVRGKPGDERSDVFALGAILYTLLTGKPPFEGRRDSVLYKAVHEEPVRPSVARPGAAGKLEAICLKSMRKDPLKRYQSVEELILALEGKTQKAFSSGIPAWVPLAAMAPVVAILLILILVALRPETADKSSVTAASQEDNENTTISASATSPSRAPAAQPKTPAPDDDRRNRTQNAGKLRVERGRLLYEADFSGEGSLGNNWGKTGGAWTVKDGACHVTHQHEPGGAYAFGPVASWGDCIIECEMRVDQAIAGLLFRHDSAGRCYGFRIRLEESGDGCHDTPMAYLDRVEPVQGSRTRLRNTTMVQADYALPRGVYQKIRVEAVGGQLTAFVNGEELLSFQDDNPIRKGGIGFTANEACFQVGIAHFRNVKVWEAKPIQAPTEEPGLKSSAPVF